MHLWRLVTRLRALARAREKGAPGFQRLKEPPRRPCKILTLWLHSLQLATPPVLMVEVPARHAFPKICRLRGLFLRQAFPALLRYYVMAERVSYHSSDKMQYSGVLGFVLLCLGILPGLAPLAVSSLL